MTLKDDAAPEQNNTALHVGGNDAAIINNRKNVADFLRTELDQFVCAEQPHSANFHKVTREDAGRGATAQETAIPDTDALYTFEKNIVLCTFSADCVPVIFYNEETGLIGVIHSGWQGTAKEIASRVFRHLQEAENCNLEHFYVQIGAAISQEKFEVDRDVYEKFLALGYAEDFIEYKPETDKYHIDNQRTVKEQCKRAGIPSGRINIDSTCTFLHADGFSYRQDRQTGRHMSFIMRKQGGTESAENKTDMHQVRKKTSNPMKKFT